MNITANFTELPGPKNELTLAQMLAAEEGVYQPVGTDYEHTRVIVVSGTNPKKRSAILMMDATLEMLEKDSWTDDRFVKTDEEIEIIFR